MINTTTEFKQAMEQNNVCASKATILLKNGTLLDIPNSKISQGGIKIEDATSSTSNFDIGSAIINKLTISLNNMYDEFSDYDFTDAVVTVWVGKQLSDRMEWLKKGVYITDDPTATPSILTLEALDNMSKFDVVYDGNLTFPATLQTIVQYCCWRCGVTMISGQFPNYNYQVSKNPFDEKSNITYRAILAYCAQIAGCYARCNADGNLELKWYDTAAFDGIIDGGVFDKTTEPSYQTGDDLDGGNFTDYSSGDTADGGNFTDPLPYHHIYSLASLSVSTEDVMITGIRVTAADSESSDGKKLEGETYLCGVEGYVLHIKGNPLIEYGRAKEVAEFLGARINLMRFRPLTASCLGDPSMEAGDAAVVTDRKGNSYYTYLTNISYSTGNYASISCDAEPAARHSADRYSEVEKIVAEIKKDSQFQLSEYAQHVNQMNQLAINAMGYYETNEPQDDGSTINYMHDKPLLSESTIIYKKTIDGFFISRDGGQTYVGGMDKNANIVANVIAAIGISFDWASGGTLTLGGKDNTAGLLKILNEIGEEICRLDNTGANITGDVIMQKKVVNRNDYLTLRFGNIQYYDSFEKQDVSCIGLIAKSNPNDPGNRNLEGLLIIPSQRYSSPGLQNTIYSHGRMEIISNTNKTNETGVSQILMNGASVSISNGMRGRFTISQGHMGFELHDPFKSLFSLTESLFSAAPDFVCNGSKSRVIKTTNYGEVLQYCYETPSPLFGDIGEGCTDENGECYIMLDDVFQETVNTDMKYSVFLQREGTGDLWIDEKTLTYFKVKGTSGLHFSWEVKARQRDYEYRRLDTFDDSNDETEINYENEAAHMVKQYISNLEDQFILEDKK